MKNWITIFMTCVLAFGIGAAGVVLADTPDKSTKPTKPEVTKPEPNADTYQHLGLMLANIQLKNSLKQAEKEYQEKVLQAKKDYVKQLHTELKKAVDKGDSDLTKVLVLRISEVKEEINLAMPESHPKVDPAPVKTTTNGPQKWEGVYKFAYGKITIQPDGKTILDGIHKGTGVSVKIDNALLITWNEGNRRALNEIFVYKDGTYRSFHSNKVVEFKK